MDSTKLKRTYFTNEQTKYRPTLEESRQSTHTFHRNLKSNLSMTSLRPRKTQILVYCPVCKRDYLNSQLYQHAQVHDLSDSYHLPPSPSQQYQYQPPPVFRPTQYPLVEPLEFFTNQVKQSQKKDRFVYRQNRNYDKVDRQYFKQKKTVGVQTLERPPLQYERSNYDLYNFVDNAFNDNGPKFSMDHVYEQNQGIADKRRLSEWESARINQKQRRR